MPPEPESRKPPKKIPPTPEQIAKIVTAKRPSPVGQLDKAELTLRLVLPAVLERLTARAIRETRKLEALIKKSSRPPRSKPFRANSPALERIAHPFSIKIR